MKKRFFGPVLGLFLLLGACTAKAPVITTPASTIELGFLTGLGGITEPCGCTSHPLGGLDRLASRLETLSEKGAFAFAVTGETFFEHDDPPGHLVEQEAAKAEAIAEILGRLKPAAVVVGERDLKAGQERLQRWGKTFQLPLFQPPKNVTTHFRADHVLRTIGGHKVGFIGLPGMPAPEEAVSMSRGALALRAQGAELVIALLPIGGEDARAFTRTLNAIDVAVAGGVDGEELPEVVDGTLLVDGGIKGKNLGLLKVHWLTHPKAGKGFVYYDRGEVKRSSLEKRIRRLENTIDRMAPGAGRAVRQDKLEVLTRELAAFSPKAPEVPYVTWERAPVGRKAGSLGWATARLAQYNRSLCDITIASTRDLLCPVASEPAEVYVGTARCMGCHAEAHRFYEGTRHAHAFDTLEEVGKNCDLGCIGCHTVGFNEPGGYCRVGNAETNKNVGCENCHGPGAGHAGAPYKRDAWGSRFTASPGEEVCATCHNDEHSDQFDFETYLKKILGPGHADKAGAR
jgi:hypothetical protein